MVDRCHCGHCNHYFHCRLDDSPGCGDGRALCWNRASDTLDFISKITWVVAILASVLIGLGFVLSESSDELWKVVFNRGLALGVVWTSAVLVVYQKIASRQLKDVAMFHEIKGTLIV